MKIIVSHETGHGINLRLPTGLLLNSLTAKIVCGFLNDNGVSIPRSQMNVLFHELERYRKKHPDWKLVEVDSADGEHVEVVI